MIFSGLRGQFFFILTSQFKILSPKNVTYFFLKCGSYCKGRCQDLKKYIYQLRSRGGSNGVQGVKGCRGDMVEMRGDWKKNDSKVIFWRAIAIGGLGFRHKWGAQGGWQMSNFFLKASRKYIPSSWLLWIRLLRSRKATRPQKLPRMARNLKSCGKIVNVV